MQYWPAHCFVHVCYVTCPVAMTLSRPKDGSLEMSKLLVIVNFKILEEIYIQLMAAN